MEQKVIVMSICWGDENDEENCRKVPVENSKIEKGLTSHYDAIASEIGRLEV